MIKSFRGRLTDGEQERIRLHTNDGLTGYKIVKFQIMDSEPGVSVDVEHVVKVYTKEQDSITGTIDFRDPLLLAAGFSKLGNGPSELLAETIIFDNMTVNQDVFVTALDNSAANGTVNYYIEMERVKLSHDEAAVATLKDMRAGPDTRFGP